MYILSFLCHKANMSHPFLLLNLAFIVYEPSFVLAAPPFVAIITFILCFVPVSPLSLSSLVSYLLC